MLTRKITNEELSNDSTYGPMIKSGSVIIIDKEITANPEYTTLFLAGIVEQESSSSMSSMQRLLLGFGGTQNYIARCVQNSATEIADGLSIGDTLNGAAIRIVDTTTPYVSRDGVEQEPRVDRNGKVYTHNGEKIYRNYELVSVEELEEMGHYILKRDSASAPIKVEQVSSVTKEQLFESKAVATA